MLGLIFVVASVNFGVYLLFRDLFLAGVFGMDVPDEHVIGDHGWWVQSIVITLITITQALFNHFGIKTHDGAHRFLRLPDLRRGDRPDAHHAGLAPSCDLSRLFAFVNNTGDSGRRVVPSRAPPRRLPGRPALSDLHDHRLRRLGPHLGGDHATPSTPCRAACCTRSFWSLVFGFFMAVSFVLAMPDLTAAAKDGGNTWFNLFDNLPMPKLLKDLLAIGIVVANYICALGRHDLDVAHGVRLRPRRRPAGLEALAQCQPGPPHAGGGDLD